MRRIFSDFAYGDGPRHDCWWDHTCNIPVFDPLAGDLKCDVAIVGAGFTGVSAALHLARAGAQVAVLEARKLGWGASGRNGGFCCLGGGRASDALLDRRYGVDGRLEWRAAEKQAVSTVEGLINDLELQVDRHSTGETLLAHSVNKATGFEAEAKQIAANYGVVAEVLDRNELRDRGFGGAFHAALTTPIGFGLNPRKFLAGLVAAAEQAGVRFFEETQVVKIEGGQVQTAKGRAVADRVIIATNGYSSEDVPEWMAGRYMPVQSSVLVTERLSSEKRSAMGWTTDQMCYDTRQLLHYFRMLPDGRFLFGMRGGLGASPKSEANARAKAARNFRAMFPAWSGVAITHSWSGMVCFAPTLQPVVGAIKEDPTVLVGYAFHGNGVAMGTFTGRLLAALATGTVPDLYPKCLHPTRQRFPLGRLRRALMLPIYAGYRLQDALS